MDKARIATLGLAGWHEQGGGNGTTWSRGPLKFEEVTAPILADLSEALRNSENPVKDIWKRPNLDLNLPDRNVRNLCEGCIGCAGKIEGHEWDGKLESLESTDSVGLDVYVAILEASGAQITRR